MHKYLYFLVLILFHCKTSQKIGEVKSDKCGDYSFGMIEAKRLLTDEEKLSLESQGIKIQEFLFETVYQGIWNKNWNSKKLNTTPIKSLRVFQVEDKLSEGIIVKDLTGDNTPCNIIIQTFVELNREAFNDFGKLVILNNKYYRMETQKKHILDIAKNDCVKHISLMKSIDIPDLKD